MGALGYIFCAELKNSLKELIKNPGKLVVSILLIISVVFVVVAGVFGKTGNPDKVFRDVNEVYAIIYGVYLMVFMLMVNTGFSSGATFYSMADVLILFQTPISSKRILFYGLIKQMGTSLLMGFFIVYQYGWLANVYNFSVGGLFAILIGYCFIAFCGQLTAMVIYSFTSNNEKIKRIIKTIIYAIIILSVGSILVNVFIATGGKFSLDAVSSIADSVNKWYLNLLPVVGWAKFGVVGFCEANLLWMIVAVLSMIAYVSVLIAIMLKANTDYYEDVLQATEISASAIAAKKQGNMAEAVPKNVKVGKSGIGKGRGASTFFYKHMLENRRARLFIFDNTTLIFIATIIVFGFLMRETGIIGIFVFATYMQVFSSIMGRWTKELLLPYVYLAPVSSFKKLIAISGETVIKSILEAIVVFIPVSIFVGLSPVETVICVLARISFSLVFIAVNFLTDRIMGTVSSKVFIMFVYFAVVLGVCAPGIVLAVFAAMGMPIISAVATGFVVVALWNTLASAIIGFLCRDILNYAELNNR